MSNNSGFSVRSLLNQPPPHSDGGAPAPALKKPVVLPKTAPSLPKPAIFPHTAPSLPKPMIPPSTAPAQQKPAIPPSTTAPAHPAAPTPMMPMPPTNGFHYHYAHHMHSSGGDFRFWPYPPQMTMAPVTPTGVTTPWRRERRSKACQRCHTKKIKCEGEGPVCDGCRQAGCECRWVEMKKRGPKPKARKGGGEKGGEKKAGLSAPDALDDMEAVLRRFSSPDVVDRDTREAVECFFDFFYGRMPLFHPA
ncbi:hypothetical protein GGI21_004954, partial [Coemansia aciculifera]